MTNFADELSVPRSRFPGTPWASLVLDGGMSVAASVQRPAQKAHH
jgi:hypothetical protein